MQLNRFFIMVGDPTTVAGVVITGSPTNLWQGKQTAWEGDQVECPKCGSIGVIQCTGDRPAPSTDAAGRQQALSLDLCICKCTPPPLLVQTQTSYGVG
ncbi:PAAR domain-containing protein [Variovorax sp. J22R133]|uniref:PAAR domain-containing protein n=1 Tax=Variovorax brevis TaxID=3053503 RepID=UPI00257529AB|nr:PAAR domain-containing protein [Variovorax sp. J22R133]MDM0112588.1 PAAR domain-containing protein [Variovorax sp. J22R133]